MFEVLLRFIYLALDDKHKWSYRYLIKVATRSLSCNRLTQHAYNLCNDLKKKLKLIQCQNIFQIVWRKQWMKSN